MRFFLILFFAFVFSFPLPVLATAEKNPPVVTDVPEPLLPLVERGAQVRYLGTESGMDGWVAIYQGQEQYYYMTPDKKAFITGIMFGNDGRPITIDQVRQLQAQSGGVLDLMAEDAPETKVPQNPLAAGVGSVTESIQNASPSEKMFADVQASNWFSLGRANAPEIYVFIDPQCPHCHEYLEDLEKDYIEAGLIEARIVPVGFQPGSLAQAAFLLAAPQPGEVLMRHLRGDKDAIPVKTDLSTQAVQKNMALMQAWKFNVTPLSVYRGRDGSVKILRGKAKDLRALVADLPDPAP